MIWPPAALPLALPPALPRLTPEQIKAWNEQVRRFHAAPTKLVKVRDNMGKLHDVRANRYQRRHVLKLVHKGGTK